MKVIPDVGYCMNLDSRTDRWEQVTTDFKRLSDVLPIKIERVSAVALPQKPQQGVGMTVAKIVTMAKEEKLPYVLIMEDDLYVIDPEKVKACLENAPDDWDILSGGSYHYVPKGPYDSNWMIMKDFCSLHFIIIRDRIYDSVLGLTGRPMHLDRILGNQVKAGKMKMYLMHPMPCQQRPGFSDLRKRVVDDNKRNLPWIQHPDTLKPIQITTHRKAPNPRTVVRTPQSQVNRVHTKPVQRRARGLKIQPSRK